MTKVKRSLITCIEDLPEDKKVEIYNRIKPALDTSGVTIINPTEDQLREGGFYSKKKEYKVNREFADLISRMSELEGKLMRFMLTKPKEGDPKDKLYYLDIDEWQKMLPGGNTNLAYLLTLKNYENLFQPIRVWNLDPETEFEFNSILTHLKKLKGKRAFTFKLNPDLKQFLFEDFTEWLIAHIEIICRMQGKYTATIYEWFKREAWKAKGRSRKIDISTAYLKELIGYDNITEIHKVLVRAVDQINKYSDLHVVKKFKPIKANKGKGIEFFRFKVRMQKEYTGEGPDIKKVESIRRKFIKEFGPPPEDNPTVTKNAAIAMVQYIDKLKWLNFEIELRTYSNDQWVKSGKKKVLWKKVDLFFDRVIKKFINKEDNDNENNDKKPIRSVFYFTKKTDDLSKFRFEDDLTEFIKKKILSKYDN